ncbi:MAG: glycine--tRNA ligase subunit beta [Gammaproteobacteria bacterium]|nr:MAG: glycine--tRNA ligase subunit beta [Gammaproteobacteria bacterium]
MSLANDFILELGTEELPPLSLRKLATAFHDNLLSLIDESGLKYQASRFYATPRRLTIVVDQLDMAQADKTVNRQGPAVDSAFDSDGNATPAAMGFARSCGVEVNQLDQVDTNKGRRLAYTSNEQGQTAEFLLPDLVEMALSKLPIPKTMRWGDYNHSFIRPVKWLLMLQGSQVIPCTIFNCEASNITRGHRFMSQGEIVIDSAASYLELLESHFVIADLDKRKSIIEQQVLNIAESLNATAVINPDLLDEVTALVEWPVALAGDFDEDFLDVPQEALILTMATNQKYFHLIDDKQQLLPKFITIANVASSDPNVIVKGNERVIRPRLADAKFFFERDCKHSLSSIVHKLNNVVFQKNLGSVFDKTLRIQSLAESIASLQGVDSKNIATAALICKSDLVTDMVGEFPSLQGIMGSYYAKNDGENEQVTKAMNEIYMPRFAGDELPSTETGLYLALADRLDTLIGIFAVGLVPTGNKDPFALRRATLGILRLIIENNLTLDIKQLINLTAEGFTSIEIKDDCKNQLVAFFNGRLKAMYLEKGFSNKIIQAVQVLQLSNPLDIDSRLQAVKLFNEMAEAESLSEANKRVSNILIKNAGDYNIDTVNDSLFRNEAEKELSDAMKSLEVEFNGLMSSNNYSTALALLAGLKPFIDNFFDTVMVMDDDLSLRQNRLALLNTLRNLFVAIADISYLQK